VAADPLMVADGSAGECAGAVPPSSAPYYRDRYWNELDGVNRYLHERATGDPAMDWITHLARWHGRPFRKALVLNCGNGWVERTLLDRGVASEAVGIDIGADLLAGAVGAAGERPIRYYRLDVNEAAFPEGGYDVVVNHAAGHHISHIDRVFRAVAALLPADGVFVSWDYVGPHRNQYPGGVWEAAHEVNEALPPLLRSPMHYPRLHEMIRGDPTEAIHSELVLPTLRRYFRIEHERALGGGIAYLVLTHNPAFLDASPEINGPWLDMVLTRDAALTDGGGAATLFAYVVARPDRGALGDAARLAQWTAEEDEREAQAAANLGCYYPPTAVAAAIEAERMRPRPPGEACRAAGVALGRALARRTPDSLEGRLRRLPAVQAVWQRVSRVYRE
jgi:SAM-dependent methyltransferase